MPSAPPIEIKNPEQVQETPEEVILKSEQEIPKSEIGGGGGEESKKAIKLTDRLYIKQNKSGSYTFTYNNNSQGTFDTLQQAQEQRRKYFDLNRIKYTISN